MTETPANLSSSPLCFSSKPYLLYGILFAIAHRVSRLRRKKVNTCTLNVVVQILQHTLMDISPASGNSL
ncbi:hypothetical protein BCY80_17215 [Yersinia pestis]|nr:hypothetical protein BCY80_17215 [Yersinia pestis]